MTETFSVTSTNKRIKEILEEKTRGKSLWVQGQIFDIGTSKAGHLYFRLQDKDSRLACVAFRTTAERFPSLGDGMTVKVLPEAFSLYPHGGQYQAIVKDLTIVDATTYRERRERTLKKLEEEAQRPRQQIPSPLRNLGIIAAEDSEVIEDIKGREWPDDLEVTIHSAAMQGPAAPGEIAKAISALNLLSVKAILITRGGGDYWEIAEVFDNEGLARAIARSKVPVAVALGHSGYDDTIAEKVADRTFRTPSAARWLVQSGRVQSREELQAEIARLERRVKELREANEQLTRSRDRVIEELRKARLQSAVMPPKETVQPQPGPLPEEKKRSPLTLPRLLAELIGWALFLAATYYVVQSLLAK